MNSVSQISHKVWCCCLVVLTVWVISPVKMANALPKTPSLQVLVNRHYPLDPTTFIPPDLVVPHTSLASSMNDTEMELRKPAAEALTRMFAAASKDDINLMLSSGYRSYIDQALLYDDLIASNSSLTDAVAPPGTSEHQTGLAADIVLQSGFCAAQDCFGMTRASLWLVNNAHRYGFITRYPLGKQAITGYEYEPWHYRYVGVSLASRLFSSGQVLEEYYRAQGTGDN
jgi:D-alanyl-D-alanine carboxypeptidase